MIYTGYQRNTPFTSGMFNLGMSVFFLDIWGMNQSAGQTNCMNRFAVLGRFVCSPLPFIPHEPRKKDTQCFHQRPFLKFTEKIYKFKFPLVTYNLIWCKSLRMWFDQLQGTTCWLCSSGIESKIFAWFNEGDIIGIFKSPKYDVNPQPYTPVIGPLVGRTSPNHRSVMHVLAVIFIKTCHFFFISQYTRVSQK